MSIIWIHTPLIFGLVYHDLDYILALPVHVRHTCL